MAWQSALLKGFKGAQTAQTVKGAIGGKKKKGGASVKKERPKMGQFVKDVEKTKVEAAPKQKLVPTLTLPQAASPGEEKSKKIEEKISLLLKFIRERKGIKEERRKQRDAANLDAKRDEKEAKKENFGKGLVKGAKNIGGKILAPVKSVWDNIMNAIGTIVMAYIGMWAIDNPGKFLAILKALIGIADVVSNVIIGALDIFGGIVSFGYDLVNGFEDWTTNDDAKKAANKFGNWAPAITAFLNTALLLGGALADEAIRKSREDNLQDRGGDPGKGKGKSTKPTKVKPRTKSSRLTKTRKAPKLARKRYARRFGKDASRRRFAGQVRRTKTPIRSKIFGRGGIGKSIKRFGIKLNPGMMKNFKFLAKMAKGIKVPIIGPILVGVGSIMGGDPLGKALFKTLGAVGGGILGSLIPIPFLGTVIGEAIGLFAGELLYEGFMGKGWGAAGQIIVDTFTGFVTGAGKFGKALLDWTFGGGLLGLLKNVGGGLLKFGKYMLGGGLIMDILKGAAGFGKMLLGWLFGGGLWNLLKKTGGGLLALANWIFIKNGGILGKLLGAIGGGAQLIGKWMHGVFTRFNENFPGFPVPDWKMPVIGWIPKVPGLRRVLGIALGWIPWFKKWMKDGELTKFPDFSMFVPGFGFPFFLAHLGKSLFPESHFKSLPSGVSDIFWGNDEKEKKVAKKSEQDKEISDDESTSSLSATPDNTKGVKSTSAQSVSTLNQGGSSGSGGGSSAAGGDTTSQPQEGQASIIPMPTPQNTSTPAKSGATFSINVERQFTTAQMSKS